MKRSRFVSMGRLTAACAIIFGSMGAWDVQAAADTAATVLNAELRAKAKEVLGIIPETMPGSDKDIPERVALGRKLFFETRLSANQSQSCNSCHAVDHNRGGADTEKTSLGAFGKHGGRNAPTVLNAGFHVAQFWDGRAATLEDQAKGPILNPIEMAMPNPEEVIARLKKDTEYPALFAKAFPGATDSITYDHLAEAIAAFERTLRTHDRFDDFLNGNDQALSSVEKKGLDLFLTTGCTTCHNGPVIGGNSYQKIGLINPYQNTNDVGRFELTKDESDKFKFKVPSLRNIALTAPYFHDGATDRLEDAVHTMGWLQLGRELTQTETSSIAAFLRSLSDKDRAVEASKRTQLPDNLGRD